MPPRLQAHPQRGAYIRAAPAVEADRDGASSPLRATYDSGQGLGVTGLDGQAVRHQEVEIAGHEAKTRTQDNGRAPSG